MAVFAYEGLTADHAQNAGTISADTARQARDQLRAQGLNVQEVRELSGSKSRSWRLWNQVRPGRLEQFIRDLSTLLSVGVPLLEALQVAQPTQGAIQRAIMRVRDRVGEGSSLAAAMSEQPDVFDQLTVYMVEVGENTGNLDQVLTQLAEYHGRARGVKDRVVSALIYPTVVLAASLGVSVFLMTVVVPMLLQNLLESGRPLPWPTRVLKGASDFLLAHGGWLLLGLGSGVVCLAWGMKTQWGRRLSHRALLRMPLVGDLAIKQSVARLATVMTVLLRSGMEFLRGLEIARQSAGNIVISDALEACGQRVNRGMELGEAMQQAQLFPPVVVQVFSVGQQTGRLEEMLERLAGDYDRQVSTLTARLASILEPALILVLSVIVGFILFATVLPILEAGNVF